MFVFIFTLSICVIYKISLIKNDLLLIKSYKINFHMIIRIVLILDKIKITFFAKL